MLSPFNSILNLYFRVLNYCRIFTEYGENMVPYMLRSWRDPHYSIQVISKILDCEGHHDYEVFQYLMIITWLAQHYYGIFQVAEMTFGFWYRLSEDLYHAHDESLNAVFRSYAQRLVVAMYKHSHIEPDHVRYFQFQFNILSFYFVLYSSCFLLVYRKVR